MTRDRQCWQVSALIAFTFLILTIGCLFNYSNQISSTVVQVGISSPPTPQTWPGERPVNQALAAERLWEKPQNLTVIAVVFYGRQDVVEILKCFLEKNLASKGGWLHQIVLAVNTKDREDLEYLHSLESQNPDFKAAFLADDSDESVGSRYEAMWELAAHEASKLVSSQTLIVKIDDDVLWIGDEAIPRMVTMKMNNPEYLLVSANLINSPLLSKLHYDAGAYYPYLPEVENLSNVAAEAVSPLHTAHRPWQPWAHRKWEGSPNYSLRWDTEPYKGFLPWRRLKSDHDLQRTPIVDIRSDTWGPGWSSWSIAAQSHYSFLENLAVGKLNVYHRNLTETWLPDGMRLSINFIVIALDDLVRNLPIDPQLGGDDEEWLTRDLPRRLKRPVAVCTEALAVHYAFAPQLLGLKTTDLLARFQSYAEENVCRDVSL